MKKLFLFATLLLSSIWAYAQTSATDYMTTESITVAQGDVVPVRLFIKNPKANACAWQCDITLPEGITLADEGVTKAAKCADSHVVKYNKLDDGTIRIICYSLNNDAFKSVDEAVATFNINISGTMPLGKSNIIVKNTVLSTEQTELSTDEAGQTSQLTTVTNVKGDVNLDETVDISDVNSVISVICGTGTAYRSDVNKDKTTDISDVNSVISIICGK